MPIKNFLIVYNWRESRLDHWRDIDPDYEEVASGAIRWRNRTRWAGNALKNAGLLLRRDDGMWELSETGRESAKSGTLPEKIRGRRKRGDSGGTVER
jgi:hypothetical protein